MARKIISAINHRFRSLRGRLMLAAIVVGVIFAVLFGGVAIWQLRHAESRAINAALVGRVSVARQQVRSDGTLRIDPANPKTDLLQVVLGDGTVLSSSPALRGVAPLAVPAELRTGRLIRHSVSLQSPDRDLAILATPIKIKPAGRAEQTAALVIGLDTEGFGTANDGMLRLLIIGLVLVVIVLALLSWLITGRALRNVSQLTERAELVEWRDLDGGLPVPVGDAELSRLVNALNRMLARLHRSHASELAFAVNAGHRLRTPLATLRAEAELALVDDDHSEQGTALRQIITDADHLTAIVNQMLARSNRRAAVAADAGRPIDQVIGNWRRQARIGEVDLELDLQAIENHELCDVIMDAADPVVENGIAYTPPGGRVSVRASQSVATGLLTVDVVNTGSTVPAELRDQIFQAWVSSRDGSEAGGLGLWVARTVARDVGGDVRLLPTGDGLTWFQITVPRVVRR